jgi:hypothetical protein
LPTPDIPHGDKEPKKAKRNFSKTEKLKALILV